MAAIQHRALKANSAMGHLLQHLADGVQRGLRGGRVAHTYPLRQRFRNLAQRLALEDCLHSDPVGALEQAAALFLGQAVQLVKTGFTGRVVHGLMNPCAISSRVSDAAGSAICLLNARQAQQLGSRPAPLDELAHAGGEVAAAQAALLQAVADLLEAVDAGGGEALDPAADRKST